MDSTKEKILLLLLAGVSLAFSYTSLQQWRVIKRFAREWKKIDRQKLRKEINYLYKIKVIDKQKNEDGSVHVVLTEKGQLRALHCQLDAIKNKKGIWDKKWRMVAFDMPERFKKGRDALRQMLKRIGFCELQKSVFICPYDCLYEIGLLVAFFNLGKYVRLGILEFIDNEKYFKKVFNLG